MNNWAWRSSLVVRSVFVEDLSFICNIYDEYLKLFIILCRWDFMFFFGFSMCVVFIYKIYIFIYKEK